MKNIKYLVMDVDGTLTDGKIYMGNTGELFKVFDIKDGCGIHDILIPKGIKPIIITGRKSDIVLNRCKELEIKEVHQGISNKIEKLCEILEADGNSFSDVAYIGDDINDLACMESTKINKGFIGCPADAAKEVVVIADFVSSKNGGNGAVREFIDWLIMDTEQT